MPAVSHIRLTEPKVRDYVARGVDPDVLDSRGKPRPRIYRDDKVRGLFIEVNPLSASYKVQSTLRKAGPRPITIRRTLGRTTDYTLEQARRWTEDVLGTVRRGELPTDTADAEPTLRSLYERYAVMRKRLGKDATHTSNIQLNSRTHLGDWLDFRVSKITQPMVEERHIKIGNGYHQGRRAAPTLPTIPSSSCEPCSTPTRPRGRQTHRRHRVVQVQRRTGRARAAS